MSEKCDCRSYNQPELGGSTPEVVVRYQDYFPDSGKETVCIDPCIVEPMKALWEAGIETGGCCCGHNRDPAPTVFVRYPSDVKMACEILLQNDNRNWHVVVWSKSGGSNE